MPTTRDHLQLALIWKSDGQKNAGLPVPVTEKDRKPLLEHEPPPSRTRDFRIARRAA